MNALKHFKRLKNPLKDLRTIKLIDNKLFNKKREAG